MLVRNVFFGLCMFGLAGCMTTGSQDAVGPTQTEKVFSRDQYINFGYKELSYSASGKTYTLFVLQKAKGNFGMDKVHTFVSQGPSFSGTTSDDAEVQNMVRDAYRALKLCPANLHPGLTNFAYGPILVGDVPMWNVFVRCTEKVQRNI